LRVLRRMMARLMVVSSSSSLATTGDAGDMFPFMFDASVTAWSWRVSKSAILSEAGEPGCCFSDMQRVFLC
jgi:hypothetical protein